ncbi:MAG TPA: MFS transporter [Stellaceae bacterium]|nr:MFS transporter [Stellaceae bacterium]
MPRRLAAGRLHYAWIIAAVAFAVAMLSAGIRATPGVLIIPLEQEFHWSRATISLAVGVNLLLYGAVGPFAASLMDRFGVRRTIALALTATAAGVALTPTIHHTWQLVLLWGVVVGIGCGFIGSYLAAYIAARWFKRRVGLVIGVLTAANAAGQLVFLPSMAAIATAAGWRTMSLSLAAVVVAFVPLLVWLMRERPQDLGILPYGDSGIDDVPPPPQAGNPIAAALHTFADGAKHRDFWLIAGGYFICGASTNGLITTHLIPACVDHGLSEEVGAGLLATTGVFAFFGGLLSGWASDRWDNRVLLCLCYGLRGLSLMYLPFAFDLSFAGLSVWSVFYGFDWIVSVPPTVRLLTRIIGNDRIGMMVAWITVVHQLGAASAAYLGGVLRLDFGSYLEAFMASGLMCICAALMVLFIGVGGAARTPAGAPAAAG